MIMITLSCGPKISDSCMESDEVWIVWSACETIWDILKRLSINFERGESSPSLNFWKSEMDPEIGWANFDKSAQLNLMKLW